MKVILLNGSAKPKGCTWTSLQEMEKILNADGIGTEVFYIGNEPLRDCTACMKCKTELTNQCAFDAGGVNEFIEKAKDADGFVFASPVYFAHPSGRILSFLDRVYYSSASVLRHKPACAVVNTRRAGTTAALDVLNKYISYAEMPLVTSSYWNLTHGVRPEEVFEDEEGTQTIRNLARNLSWVMRSLDAGRQAGITPPVNEYGAKTNFVR